ncbi:MAG: MFS transporter, partial [Marmoricola sp.]
AIQRDLSMSTSALEWIAAAYTLALAVGLMTGARLGDMFGRKQMLIIGLAGFVTSSAFCAFAWSADVLVGGRAVQGLAAAMMVPQTFGLIRDVFPPAQIGKAFAAFGPTIGLSTVLGPVVAGQLMKANLFGTEWRALFLMNLPVGVFALFVGAKVLPAGAPSHAGLHLDVVGALLLAVASFLLVFPLVDGRTQGWPTWMFGLLVASVPMFGLFIAQQRARLRAGCAPLVELSVLRKRSYVSGVLFTLVFFGTLVGFSLTIGLFLQIGLGFTAAHASLYLAAMAVGAFFGAGVGAWAAIAIGRPILHLGLSLMAVGTLVLYLSLRSVDGSVGVGTLGPGLGVFGLGMGMIFVPLFSIIMGRDRRPGGRQRERVAGVAPTARRLARRGRARHAVLRQARPGGRWAAQRDGCRTPPGRSPGNTDRRAGPRRRCLGDRLAPPEEGTREDLSVQTGTDHDETVTRCSYHKEPHGQLFGCRGIMRDPKGSQCRNIASAMPLPLLLSPGWSPSLRRQPSLLDSATPYRRRSDQHGSTSHWRRWHRASSRRWMPQWHPVTAITCSSPTRTARSGE